MSCWKDNGRVIIPRELDRWAGRSKLKDGPILIISMSEDRYVLSYRQMRISFRDGHGVIGGVMWPEGKQQQSGGAGPYRQRIGPSKALRRYRQLRARAMERAMDSTVDLVAYSKQHDVRAFLIYGSYVRAIRNVLALAQMTKVRADGRQRGSGYICLDHRDELPLQTVTPPRRGR